MPKGLGGTSRPSAIDPRVLDVTHRASHSDPSVPLVSVFSLGVWELGVTFLQQQQSQQQPHPPRPRPSLQVYYTAPDAADPARLESAARALETTILRERHDCTDPGECDRLDVYGMPLQGTDEHVVAACIEHQRREIASRLWDKDWYIQRYDTGSNEWRRALVIVREGQEAWVGDDGSTRPVGLSVVFFDPVGWRVLDAGMESWERRADSVEEEKILIGDLKAELKWQNCTWQFED
ncbi:hypothetical protein GGR58DRAFT_12205 [Xylaria digitata]|nr:hypothetical protein GGR58DRAFT_12205 [Xylaria digitata]